MSFRSILLYFAATVCATFPAGHDAFSRLDKPPLWDNLDDLEQGLQTNLNASSFISEQWPKGWIPKDCYTAALDNHVNASELQVHNVFYDDCTDPWIICHHPASGVTNESLFRQFGKLPVHMRQWVRHLTAIPAYPGSGGAYENQGNIVTLANSDHMISLLVHETGHSLDLNGAYGADGPPLSSSDAWWEGYALDSTVPDSYAQTDMAENVAQNHVVALYNLHVPHGISHNEPSSDGIFHQHHTLLDMESRAVENGTRLLKWVEGAVCTQRLNNSAPVSAMDGSSPLGQPDLGGPPDVTLGTQLKIIEPNENRPAKVDCPFGLNISNIL